MIYLVIILLLALIFYVIIPGSGAFLVRKQWFEFRKKLTEASNSSTINFHSLRTGKESGYRGLFRFMGKLEAIQGNHEIWLRNGNFTLSVDLENVKLYLIPAFSWSGEENSIYEKNRETIMDEVPRVLKWDRFFSLSQQTEMMIYGHLFIEQGKVVFKNCEKGDVFCLIYDGSEESLLRRSVWAGRHRNEFWNIFTPVSLIAGSFSIFFFIYYFFSVPGMETLSRLALSFSLIPFMPLFPPWVILFFLYRSFWKKGRFFRAERDLIKLPLRFFEKLPETSQSDVVCIDTASGKKYCCRKLENFDQASKICMETARLHHPVRIRGSLFPSRFRSQEEIYYYFYPDEKYDKDSDPFSFDSLLERVIIEGEPEELLTKCRKLSKFYEYCAVAVFFAVLALSFFSTWIFLGIL